MVNLIFASAFSACFEILGKSPYFSKKKYDVFLDGKRVINDNRENVFSIFDLTPDTSYRVTVNGETVEFKTEKISDSVDVVEQGAVGDGVNDDTFAIQRSIDICPVGGAVVVPKGNYSITPIRLKSGITLYLKEGAKLVAVTDPKQFPVMPAFIVDENGNEKVVSSWEGEVMKSYASVVGGYDLNNVKIVGQGVIDGNAQNGPWWQKEYVYTREIARPRVIFLNNCENVRLHGVTAQNGATWNVHPFFCKDVGFYDVKINAPKNSPNTDGLNPEACDGVEIIGCVFSTGDDCIAIKSGTRPLAEKYKKSAENYTIRNCLMKDGHGAVVIGSEMSGGVKNLSVSQCVFSGTDRGLRIKTRRKRGKLAVVDGVEFSNIKMQGVLTPLVVNMFYACGYEGKEEYVWSRKKFPLDEGTPYMGSFLFKDIECVDCEVCAGYFDGLPERPIEKIVIENMSFTFKEEAREGQPGLAIDTPIMRRAGLYFNGVKKVILNNVKFENVLGDYVIRKNCGEE